MLKDSAGQLHQQVTSQADQLLAVKLPDTGSGADRLFSPVESGRPESQIFLRTDNEPLYVNLPLSGESQGDLAAPRFALDLGGIEGFGETNSFLAVNPQEMILKPCIPVKRRKISEWALMEVRAVRLVV